MAIGVKNKRPGGSSQAQFFEMRSPGELFNVPAVGVLNLECYLRALQGIELNKTSLLSKITDGGQTLWFRVAADGQWEVFGLLDDLVDLSEFYTDLSHVNRGYVKSRTGKQELAFTLTEIPGASIALGNSLNNPTEANLPASTYSVLATGKFQIDFLDDNSDPVNVFDAFSYPIRSGDTMRCDVIFDGTAKVIKGYVEYYVSSPGVAFVNSYDAAMQPADGIIPSDFIFRFDLYNQ